MHILLIHQAFATIDEPGGTRHHEIARFLAAAGHRVSIIASPVSYLTGKHEKVQKVTQDANGQITISVPMKASYLAGTYTGYWALQGEDGVNFFTNNSVKIIVTSDAFRVTSVTTNLKDRNPTCPYDYYYSISITTSSAGTVKYRLSDNEGNSHNIRSLTFSSAST